MTLSSFKWVEARNKCNADLCFDLLVEQVQSDVESINNLKARSNKAMDVYSSERQGHCGSVG